ncbi:MAG TPA: O-antigen ligase family protein [Candidatus Dormibacteraeota bacterium]|nr:O-antigen ligase family protein [Candidatus Dormibacteraeota bacterium]
MSAAARTCASTWTRRGAWIAFAALLVLSPFRAGIDIVARPVGTLYSAYTDVILAWSDVAGLLVLVLWLTSLALRPRRVWLGPRFIAWPVAALLLLAWVGALVAVDPAIAVNTSVHLTLLAALALYVANEIGPPQRLAVPVAVMVAIQAVVGIGQVVTQRSLGLGALGEQTLDPHQQVSVITAADGTRFLRAYGLTDHPNILGGLLAAGLLLLIGLGSRRRAARVPLLATVAVGLAALLVTFSRGAWLGMLVGLGVLAAMLLATRDRARLRQLAIVCAAGAVVAAPFVVPYRTALAARTNPAASATETRSIDERAALALATAQIVTRHPLLGVGAGGLPEAMRLADPGFRYTDQPSSIVLLDAVAETGIAGGAAYAVLLVAPWVALLRHRRRWTAELAATSAALAALTVVGLFDYYTWTYASGRIWAWAVLGLWAAAHRQATAGTAHAV